MTDEQRRLPEAWPEEGSIDNIAGIGCDLLYYRDVPNGIFHFVLVMHESPTELVKIAERTFFTKDSPEARLVMDGVKGQWAWAQDARKKGDEQAAIAFTYRGLRLVFPDLPEDPIVNARNN